MALSVPFISATFSRAFSRPPWPPRPSGLGARLHRGLFLGSESRDFLLVAVVLFAAFCVAFFALIAPSCASSPRRGDVHKIICTTNNCRRGVIVQSS